MIFLGYTAMLASSAAAGPALKGNSQWQDGELGNKLGAIAADALGLPGAKERLDAMEHDPGLPRSSQPSPTQHSAKSEKKADAASPSETERNRAGDEEPQPEPGPTPE